MDIFVLKVFVYSSNVVMDSLFGAFSFSILLSGSMESSRPWLVSINSSFKFCSFNKFLFTSLARSKNSPFNTSSMSLGELQVHHRNQEVVMKAQHCFLAL